ncbi:autophagy protein apg9 protein [Toxoplasma gondii ME49]|uniref:Autophagy-related protein 9 n=2 Tax=Toxoplasma gondii TaxID=5811 RepID=S8F4C4_TOXGM|nr:autophagy protein apg9 protein [Toxoplasma gondii ME49]EPT29527.1 autophagy protein apg9 protein [Toxoplasma gondii ME49]KYF41516.1 autophagy protein apg9 protein [Toxoplasma gondii ARI]|eukprot:XP_018637079.1 autophagy protein apg9 protein [Toxoplasma gondii ME49]
MDHITSSYRPPGLPGTVIDSTSLCQISSQATDACRFETPQIRHSSSRAPWASSSSASTSSSSACFADRPHTHMAHDEVLSVAPPQSESYPGRSTVFPAYGSSPFSSVTPGNHFFSLVTAPLRLLLKLQQGAFRRLSLTLPPAPVGFSPFLPPLLGDASHRREEDSDLENPSTSLPSLSPGSSSCLRYQSGAVSGLPRSRRGGDSQSISDETVVFASAGPEVRATRNEKGELCKRYEVSQSRSTAAAASGVSSWDAVADLDKFLYGVYRYWMDGGLFAILSAHLAHLTALAFTIYFSWFLILFVNWKDIVSCTSEEQCRAVPLLIASPFHPWGYKQTLCTVYVVSLSAFLLFNIVVSYLNCRDALLIRTYFRERLFIPSDAVLQLLDWPEVTALLLKAQEAVPFCIVTNELSALDIASTIMREENYFIALTNKNILTQKLPPWIPPKLLYTQVMQWNIRRSIFSRLFDERQRIYRNLFTSPPRDELSPYQSAAAATLASRFKLLSILNLVFLVPLFLFIFFFFFLKHAEDFRLNRQSIVRREFNGYAYWVFREFNELPHQINHRLTLAAAAADDYLQLSPISPSVLHIRLLVKYLVGSLLSIFILLYLFDETPLLFIKIFDRNLLWYTIILGVLYAGIRDTSATSRHDSGAGGRGGAGFTASDGVFASPGGRGLTSPLALYERCMRVVEYTHHLPACWRAPAGIVAIPPPPLLSASVNEKISTKKQDIQSSFSACHTSSCTSSPSFVRPVVSSASMVDFSSSLSLLPPVPPRTTWMPSEGGAAFPSSSVSGDAQERQRVTGVSMQHKMVMHAFCASFYGLRITCLLEELLAVLATPFLLWWFMPRICDDICAFLFSVTAPSSFGDVCCFSSLDLEKFGSSCYQFDRQGSCVVRKNKRGSLRRSTLSDAGTRAGDAPPWWFDEQQEEGEEAEDGSGGEEELKGEERRVCDRGGILQEGKQTRWGRDVSADKISRNGREGDGRERRGGLSSLSPKGPARGLAFGYAGESKKNDHDGEGDSGDAWRGTPRGLLSPLHANSGKVEKSALTFVLTYRIPPPYDDTSPLWTVFASDFLATSMVAASHESESKVGVSSGLSETASFSTPHRGARLPLPISCPVVRWGYPASAVRFALQLEKFQREQIRKYPYLSHELAPDLLEPLNAFPTSLGRDSRRAGDSARRRWRRRRARARRHCRSESDRGAASLKRHLADELQDGELQGDARRRGRRCRRASREREEKRDQGRHARQTREGESGESEERASRKERGGRSGGGERSERRERGKDEVKRGRMCGVENEATWKEEASRCAGSFSSKKRRRESGEEQSILQKLTTRAQSEEESVVVEGGTGEGTLGKNREKGSGGGTGEEGCSLASAKEKRLPSPVTHPRISVSKRGAAHASSRGRREVEKARTKQRGTWNRGQGRSRHTSSSPLTTAESSSTESSSCDASSESASESISESASESVSEATSSGPSDASCNRRASRLFSGENVDIRGLPPMPFERQAPYFFWLERLYEQQSGRVLFATNQLNFFTRCFFRQFPPGAQDPHLKHPRRKTRKQRRQLGAETLRLAPSLQGCARDSSSSPDTDEEERDEEERDKEEQDEEEREDRGSEEEGERVIFDQSRETETGQCFWDDERIAALSADRVEQRTFSVTRGDVN